MPGPNSKNWLKTQLKKFDSLMKQPKGRKNPKSKAAQETTFVLAQLAGAIISSLVSSWLAQDIMRNNFPMVVIIAFAILLIVSMMLQTKLRLQLSAYFLFSSMITMIIIEGVLLAYLYVTTRPPTLYLVVDATEGTKDSFEEIFSNVQYAIELQPANTNAGFRVFGGNITPNNGCGTTEQLTPPIPVKDYEAELQKFLPNLQPQGNASFTIAVLRAIKDDLKNTRGPVKLVVVTSGLDKKCEPEQSGIFEEIAKDIKENTRTDVTIVIISVGELSQADLNILDEHAKAFNGTHINTISPGSLALLLYAPRDYFVDYPNRITPQPTYSPTP